MLTLLSAVMKTQGPNGKGRSGTVRSRGEFESCPNELPKLRVRSYHQAKNLSSFIVGFVGFVGFIVGTPHPNGHST